MQGISGSARISRRGLLVASAGFAGTSVYGASTAAAEPLDEEIALIQQLTGKLAVESDRVRLAMPKTFPNGYTVPLAFNIAKAATDAGQVTDVRVLAPKNPIVDVSTFHFAAGSLARVSTRIRLAEPQFVVVAAECKDGEILMAKTWVDVSSNGCE